MAFGQAPLSRELRLAYAYDPAFDVGRYKAPGVEAEDADKKWLADYEKAVETLDFQPLCVPGQTPTIFRFRPLKAREFDMLGRLGADEGSPAMVVFRCCLEGVENAHADLTGFKKSVDPSLEAFGQIVDRKATELFGGLSEMVGKPMNHLIYMLGNEVVKRHTQPSPSR